MILPISTYVVLHKRKRAKLAIYENFDLIDLTPLRKDAADSDTQFCSRFATI